MKKMSKKKMMTGGMSNTNAKATVDSPSTKGVKPNVNPKAVATPAKMYGGKMSKGGAVKSKMGYGGMKKKAC